MTRSTDGLEIRACNQRSKHLISRLLISVVQMDRELHGRVKCVFMDIHIIVSTKFHDFKIVPPASPYIIIPPGGIIIYELAGGNISKKRNVVDPTYKKA